MALALSLAIHEIIAGLVPNAPSAPPSHETLERVTLARIEHRPTPSPTPKPAPPPRMHARIIAATAPSIVVAPLPAGRSAQKAIVRRAGASRPRPPVVTHSKPVWDLPTGAQGAGAGAHSGAGSTGNGGDATGSGTAGSGSGAGGGTEPCGFVTFSDPHGSQYDPRTGGFWVDIRLSVRYADGHSETILLDYPFYYPNEASNPWSQQNLNRPFPTTFQLPPPDKRSSEPPIVQYVMQHTSPEGFTLLHDCPSG
ncbi:MAG: hypothetical protein JO199_05635 [Candidatus Eremiobacteraeota bacterium]|nr:hypothetical protein [Candidatus Eremiobacteraeota bacterium]